MNMTLLRNDGKNKEVNLTPLKAIRQKCLECSGSSYKGVRLCSLTNCPVYLYRMGHNPNRHGIGGNPYLEQKNYQLKLREKKYLRVRHRKYGSIVK